MIADVDKNLYYRDLMAMCVCDPQNKDCMLHHCDNYPNTLLLKNFTTGKLCENYNHDYAISFQQWQTTDRSNKVEVEFDFFDFLYEIYDQVKDLTIHHFIAESQNKYFKYAKENLSVNECVVVLDFTENYCFIVQDAVQSFKWNSFQATIHPFVICNLLFKLKKEQQVSVRSFIHCMYQGSPTTWCCIGL